MSNKKIIWLASYPKSGNTWFRVFLSNLLNDTDQPVNINELHATPIASGRSIFDENAGVSSSDLSMEEIDNLRPDLYRNIAENLEENFFQKVHDSWKVNSNGEPLFPEDVTKAVIYFIRNPLDVAVSYAHHSAIPLDRSVEKLNDPAHAFCEKTGRLYNQLRQEMFSWSKHVKSWVDESKLPLIVLRYEDMLQDTFKEFSKALEFIGIDFTREKIRAAIKNSDFRNLKEMEDREGFHEKPIRMKSFFREGKSGNYRNHLDEESVQKIIEEHGEIMRRFGYL